MLKLKYLFENFDLAKEILKEYDVDYKSLDEMLNYFRISSNAIYPFRTGKDPQKIAFLRLSPVSEKKIAAVAAEIHLLEWLNNNGYTAMKPISMNNGKFYDCINTKWGKYNVSCFEKVPGISLDDLDGNKEIVFEYGKALGKLHNILQDYPYAKERGDYLDLIADIEKKLKLCEAIDLVKSEISYLKKELKKLPTTNDVFGLIHYDFEADNVFFDEKNKTISVIDFDDSILCWYALDVYRSINCLDDFIKEDELKEAELSFYEGYRSVRIFTKEQMSSIPLLSRLVNLQEYATIKYVINEPINEQPEWMKGIVEKLTRRLKQIEKLMIK